LWHPSRVSDRGFGLCSGVWFFLCFRLLVHMGISVDCSRLGFACFRSVLSGIRTEVTRKMLNFLINPPSNRNEAKQPRTINDYPASPTASYKSEGPLFLS